jgi:hypothetical protein
MGFDRSSAENIFALMTLVCFLGVVTCYAATVVRIRNFMPDGWSWNNVTALDERVWDGDVPVSVRRSYFLTVLFLALGAAFTAGLAIMRGEVIGILLSIVAVGGLACKVVWIWQNYSR